MSFRKTLVPKVVPVSLDFQINITMPDGSIEEDHALVTHFFNRPTPAARENLGEQLNRGLKGARAIKTIYAFWAQHIAYLEGYDDLDGQEKGNSCWGGYFQDDIGLEHVQAAVLALLRKLGGAEAEFVKKSDGSQEQ